MPHVHGGLGLDGAVVAAVLGLDLEALDPAPGLERRVRLREQPGPVRYGAQHVPDVDVVEAVGLERPLLLRVVDLELHVRRVPRRLRRGQVRADDLAVRELIPHVAAKSISSVECVCVCVFE